jgi:hypothetical protein
MNANFFKVVAIVLFLTGGIRNGSSQVVYRPAVVGYSIYAFLTGSNLFNCPFVISSNSLNILFTPAGIPGGPVAPEGTTVSLWNPKTLSFETNSIFSNGVWSVNLVLPTGTGALVVTPSPFTNAFAGTLLNHDGSYLTNNIETFPNVFSGSPGIYLLGDKSPVIDNTGTKIFLDILGRMPFVGEQLTKISGMNTHTSTYLGNGQWDSVPKLAVGEAAFFNIKSEPPPELAVIYANNQAVISWPSTVSPWTLQTNTALAAGTWGNYAGMVVNNTVTNSSPKGNLFFRLSYP